MQLSQANLWLASMLLKSAGIEVAYRRDGCPLLLRLRVLIGTSETATDGTADVEISHCDRVFWLRPDSLVMDGRRSEPQPGDQIIETVGWRQFTYEVLAQPGQPAWRWADQARQFIAVETKLIAEADILG